VLKITYSNLEFQNFPGEDPRTPSTRGGKGKGEGRESREGKDREGWDGKGQGREGGREGRNEGWWGGQWRSTWAPPPPLETSSGSAPGSVKVTGGPCRLTFNEYVPLTIPKY